MVDLAAVKPLASWALTFGASRAEEGSGAAVYPETEEADGTLAQAEGDIPALRVPTGGSGHRSDEPDSAGMGALLCRGRLLPMLWLYQRLGGKESAAAFDACAEPKGLWLEEVE